MIFSVDFLFLTSASTLKNCHEKIKYYEPLKITLSSNESKSQILPSFHLVLWFFFLFFNPENFLFYHFSFCLFKLLRAMDCVAGILKHESLLNTLRCDKEKVNYRHCWGLGKFYIQNKHLLAHKLDNAEWNLFFYTKSMLSAGFLWI